MDRSCKLRLCCSCIRSRIIDTKIDFTCTIQPHQPLIARLVVRHLERAASDADDAVRCTVILRTELDAALNFRICDVYISDIDGVVFSADVDAIGARRLWIA